MNHSSSILLKYKGLNHCWKRIQEWGEELLPKMKILHTAQHENKWGKVELFWSIYKNKSRSSLKVWPTDLLCFGKSTNGVYIMLLTCKCWLETNNTNVFNKPQPLTGFLFFIISHNFTSLFCSTHYWILTLKIHTFKLLLCWFRYKFVATNATHTPPVRAKLILKTEESQVTCWSHKAEVSTRLLSHRQTICM